MDKKENQIFNDLKKCSMFVNGLTDEKCTAWTKELIVQNVNGGEFRYAIDQFKKNAQYGSFNELWHFIEEWRQAAADDYDAFQILLEMVRMGTDRHYNQKRLNYLDQVTNGDNTAKTILIDLYNEYSSSINNSANNPQGREFIKKNVKATFRANYKTANINDAQLGYEERKRLN